MKQLEILFNKNAPEYKFILNKIKNNEQIELIEKEYINYDKIIVLNPHEQIEYFHKIICEAIYSFFKFRILYYRFKDSNLSNYDKFALLGALLSVDKNNDKKIIYSSIVKLKVIALTSLMEFRNPRLLSNWKELGELAYKLTNEIDNRIELYELISYFISGVENQSRVTITDTLPLNIVVDGKIYPPLEYTNDSDINLLLSVISEGPSHVVIKNQDVLSKELLDTFRALGQQ
ncbi:MAG: hypothetical protein IJD50_01540 [Clostridia bacterium]|nr:hypothetical protein [Clostridia bacterium]